MAGDPFGGREVAAVSKLNYCENAGQARSCGDCRFNPMNQRGMAKGPSIRPTPKRSLTCPQWAAIPYQAKPSDEGEPR